MISLRAFVFEIMSPDTKYKSNHAADHYRSTMKTFLFIALSSFRFWIWLLITIFKMSSWFKQFISTDGLLFSYK